jgi:hypothetical protein
MLTNPVHIPCGGKQGIRGQRTRNRVRRPSRVALVDKRQAGGLQGLGPSQRAASPSIQVGGFDEQGGVAVEQCAQPMIGSSETRVHQ